MTTLTQPAETAPDFNQLFLTYQALKVAENSISTTTPEEEALLESATGRTDVALAALLAHPTSDPTHIADKLGAVLDQYDVLCFGLDRELGEKLFDDVLNALVPATGGSPITAPMAQCNRCRFWREDMTRRDPEDEDFGFGECRLKPPALIDSLVDAQIERPSWGSGEMPDDIMDTIALQRASRHPVTFATDWCGEFHTIPTEGR